jgi:hypothetical protein
MQSMTCNGHASIFRRFASIRQGARPRSAAGINPLEFKSVPLQRIAWILCIATLTVAGVTCVSEAQCRPGTLP